jgi:hypothetical protein
MPDQPQRHTLTLSRADQSSFPVIPVDVAPGTARIAVAYAVHAHGPAECVVDIGLRDGEGFRGWSGSARRSFFVATHQATPGYLPGALVPGRWEVVLGAYKVPHDGCTVEVTITLERGRNRNGSWATCMRTACTAMASSRLNSSAPWPSGRGLISWP